jgi:hypothetical protein
MVSGGYALDQSEIISKLKVIKRKFENEGFVILGFFGSYARGEQMKDSDIDILYELTDEAIIKYPGFKFIELYEKVKTDIEKELETTVDMAEKNSLNNIGKKYILPEVRYVA